MKSFFPALPLRSFCVALVSLSAVEATAAKFTLIDGEGFESPEYSTTFLGTGQLEGQFAATNDGLDSTEWVQSPASGTSTAVVQTAVVAAGDQAVEVNRASGSDDRWAVPIADAPTMPLVCIQWDMLVEAATGSQPFGPFFGIEAYDAATTTLLRVGSLGVDATTGDVLVTDLPSGIVETGVTVTLGDWNRFRMVLDYSTDTYYSFVNELLVFETPFESVGADQFTDADIAALAAGGDPESLAATGTAYFDNYSVFETDDFSIIPEPTSVIGLAIGLTTVGICRRSRIQRPLCGT